MQIHLSVTENDALLRYWKEYLHKWIELAKDIDIEVCETELFNITLERISEKSQQALEKLKNLQSLSGVDSIDPSTMAPLFDVAGRQGLSGLSCLYVFILAYADFAEHQGLLSQPKRDFKVKKHSSPSVAALDMVSKASELGENNNNNDDDFLLDIEIRVEEWKVYILLPVHQTFIDSVDVDGVQYTWVHSADWAKQRFLDPTLNPEEFGLCGQWPNQTKFVSLSKPFSTKVQAIRALGLENYDVFNAKDKALYVVKVDPSLVHKHTIPKVPLVYLCKSEMNKNAKNEYKLSWAENFQKGTIPGFTSGLNAELVLETFRVVADSVDGLNQQGVHCLKLD